MPQQRMKTRVPPRLPGNIHIEEVHNRDNEKIFFILAPDLPSWVFINEDGLEILKLCSGENSIDTISQTICQRHENIGYEDSLEIVSSFLEHMENSKILIEDSREKPPANDFRCLALEITKKCNLNCIHCYLSAGKTHKNELTIKEIKELLQATIEAGGISVSLGGGEPLVRDDCLEIIQYAASLDLLITLGTNGALIDEKIAKKLSGIPIKIQISLDGASKETHDSIRGAGSFDSTVKGIDHLVHERMAKDIVIAFTPMKANVDDIPGIIDFALERQIPVIQFPPLSSSGRAKKRWKELRLSNQQMLRFWEFVAKKSGELKGTMDLLADCFSISINNPGVPHRCTIGTQIRVDPGGDVYPCQCFHYGSRYCLGNIREKSLKDIVNGQRIEEIKKTCFQRPFNIEECRNCKWRNFCGSGCMGNAYEQSGTILKPESCEVRKKWIEKLFEVKLDEIRTR